MSLTRWAESRREQPPPLWRCFCEAWLSLSRTKSEQWWQALSAAAWSRPVAVRSAFLYRAQLQRGPQALPALDNRTLSPCLLIDTLEDLIQERLLPPRAARHIEEAILSHVDAAGGWRGATYGPDDTENPFACLETL
jgi:hypothetical protein